MNIGKLTKAIDSAVQATKGGKPARVDNPFFGVGPITDMIEDGYQARIRNYEFNAWIEANYPKHDDKGKVIGNFTASEINRGMHRGYPADKVLLDVMHTIHSYFGFPKSNKMAIGLGGGHSGFTACALHLMNANIDQHVFVDTPKPESNIATSGGFFRQSWATQLLEMQRYAKNGDEHRIHFSKDEGRIATNSEMQIAGINLFFGVGLETTGATTYLEEDVLQLLEWLEEDLLNRHAVIDGTSLLGAMPWSDDTIDRVLKRCCIFTPFQKAIGGVSGYYVISLTPEAIELIESNMINPCWAIPRQLKLAIPTDLSKPLSSNKSTSLGPFYDAENDIMQGGVINTFSTLALAETTWSLQRTAKEIGNVKELNKRSLDNRALVNKWLEDHKLFEPSVANPDLRSASVALFKVKDPDIDDQSLLDKIIAKSKLLLGYQGLTQPNGEYESGLDSARFINAFPGTPGDYRAWIGGIRPCTDITKLLDNIDYAYNRAKIAVLKELLLENTTEQGKKPINNQPEAPSPNRNTTTPIDSDWLRLSDNPTAIFSERTVAEQKAAFWGAIDAEKDLTKRAMLIKLYSKDIAKT